VEKIGNLAKINIALLLLWIIAINLDNNLQQRMVP